MTFVSISPLPHFQLVRTANLMGHSETVLQASISDTFHHTQLVKHVYTCRSLWKIRAKLYMVLQCSSLTEMMQHCNHQRQKNARILSILIYHNFITRLFHHNSIITPQAWGKYCQFSSIYCNKSNLTYKSNKQVRELMRLQTL